MVYATKKSNMVSIHVKLNKGIGLWVNTGTRFKGGRRPAEEASVYECSKEDLNLDNQDWKYILLF